MYALAKPIEAVKISEWAGCFRKTPTAQVYLRISESSLRFHGLDIDFVYGVAHNGNITKVGKSKLVYRATIQDLANDQAGTQAYERSIGCTKLSGDDDA